jgi:tRNA A37 threonylcarbamoyladenosine biosynthesis protein TsaE
MNIYEDRGCKLIHIDTWKIFSWDEFKGIGVDGYIQKKNVLAIEWGDKFFKEMEKFF